MRRLIVLAALLALAATACKIETNFGTVINADGSGTIIAEVCFDDEAAGFFLQDGGDPFEGFEGDLGDFPDAQQREEKRGDLTCYIVEGDVDDIQAAEDDMISAENSLLNDIDITITGDLVTVTGRASAEESLGEETEGFDASLLADSFSASVFFTMPGAITSHNADRQDGNTLYWDIPILGGSLDIQAESDPRGTPASGGGGFPVWAYGLIALVVIGAAWYFMKGRGGGAPAPPAAPPTE